VAELLTLILAQEGAREIRHTTDPFAAVRLFQDFAPDLVILDLLMPGLSGLEVLAQLHAIIPAEVYLPILVVSGDPNIETRAQVLGGGAIDFVAKPYDLNEVRARVANLLETRWLHLQLTGKRGELNASIADLTKANAALRIEAAARVEAEHALRRSEEHLRFTLNTTGIGEWDLDLQTGLSRRSLQHDRIFGYDTPCPDWTYELFLEKHVHPKDRARVATEFQRGIKADGWEFECRIIRADGEERFIWAKGSVLDASSAPRMSGLIMDVTPRKRAERELELRAAQAAAIATLGEQALLPNDISSLFDAAVNLVARTIGVDHSKIYQLAADGQSLLLRSGAGWREGVVGQARVSAGRASQAGYTLLAKESVIVEDWRKEKRFSQPQLVRDHGIMSGISVPIGHENNFYGVLAANSTAPRFFTDNHVHFLQAISNVLAVAVERCLTEESLREAKETAERANAAKTEFLSRASHELRTPMNHVLGFAQLLETDQLTDEQHQNVEQILTSGRQLLQLIDRILAVAKSDLDDLGQNFLQTTPPSPAP